MLNLKSGPDSVELFDCSIPILYLMPNKHREISKAGHREDKSPFRLADLPPEIRILIFKEYLLWRIHHDIKIWKKFSKAVPSNTPGLIKALRANPTLYSEVLDVYFDLSTLSISKNNQNRVKYLPRPVAERALSLELWYGYVHVLLITAELSPNVIQRQDERSHLGVRTSTLLPHHSPLPICQRPPSLYHYHGSETRGAKGAGHSNYAKDGQAINRSASPAPDCNCGDAKAERCSRVRIHNRQRHRDHT